jgi:hypothetical protein
VTEWCDPDSVTFTLQSETEPIEGTGRFFLRPDDGTGCVMGFDLDVHATGTAAPMINALLKRFLADSSAPFLEALRERVVDEVGQPPEPPAHDRPGSDDAAPGATATPIARTVSPLSPPPSPRPLDMPAGPGVLILEYRAPRTAAFDQWWRERRWPALVADPAIDSIERLELTTTGPVADYRELIRTRELRATAAAHGDLASPAPDVEPLRPPYAARLLAPPRRSPSERLAAAARRARRRMGGGR